MAEAVDVPAVPTGPSPEEQRLVAALRARDEAAFAELIERHHTSLVRLAMSFVSSRAVAEEVAQEAWIGVLKGIDRFEGRSSLRTWIYRILTNTAKTRAQREARSIPFASLGGDGEDGPAVDPDRFLPADDARWAGHWASFPRRWDDLPEARLLGGEMQDVIRQAIERLPYNQGEVIRLRDVEGFSSAEVCELLSLSEANQRVLLHRARTKVRAALESYLDGDA
jgi:RNA polymerase sigma-70 factor (ECF subfamily)